MEIIIEKRL